MSEWRRLIKLLRKHGPQNETGIFMGLEPNTKAYRVLIGSKTPGSRHVTFSEEKFKSTGTVDGVMPEEDEEYDDDASTSEEDCDIIIEQRRVRVHEDPFLPADDRDAQPRKPKLVENASVEEVSNNAAEYSLEATIRSVLTFPPDWNWDEQPLFDFPDTDETEPDNETDRSIDADACFSESSLREAEGSENDDASAPHCTEDSFSARDDTGMASPCIFVVGSNRYSLRSKATSGSLGCPTLARSSITCNL
jgi:hypothetical protein